MKMENTELVTLQAEYRDAWDDMTEAQARFKCARITYNTVVMLTLAKYKIVSWCIFCIPSTNEAEDAPNAPFNDITGARREYRLAWLALRQAKARHQCALERRDAALAMSPDIIYTLRCGCIGVSVYFLTADARKDAAEAIGNVADSNAVRKRLRIAEYERTVKESVIAPERIVDLHTPPMPLNEKAFAQILAKAEELKRSC